MDDLRTPVPEVVERLKLARLSGELHKTLEKSIYVRMSASEAQVYDEKCKQLRKLRQELAQAVQRADHTPRAQGAGSSPPVDSRPSIPLKPPRNEA
jgi:hypothetical protein